MNKKMIFVMVCSLVIWSMTVAAATRAAKSSTPEGHVKIDNFSFTPATLTVKAGETVMWVNEDDVPHTVVSITKNFSSQVLDTDGKFAHRFTEPGTYEYYCSVHPHMKGKIVVE